MFPCVVFSDQMDVNYLIWSGRLISGWQLECVFEKFSEKGLNFFLKISAKLKII
jgi:hypothetical protein